MRRRGSGDGGRRASDIVTAKETERASAADGGGGVVIRGVLFVYIYILRQYCSSSLVQYVSGPVYAIFYSHDNNIIAIVTPGNEGVSKIIQTARELRSRKTPGLQL